MFFYQIGGPHTKLPLRTKIGMILGIIVALSFLAIFAFTLFLVAICGGLALFVMNLFRKPRNLYTRSKDPRPGHPPRIRNDDIIDI